MNMSPSTATPGEIRPSSVPSVPMRPMWIANSMAMNDSVQPRSIGARACCAASISAARATASGSSSSPSSPITDSLASVVA